MDMWTNVKNGRRGPRRLSRRAFDRRLEQTLALRRLGGKGAHHGAHARCPYPVEGDGLPSLVFGSGFNLDKMNAKFVKKLTAELSTADIAAKTRASAGTRFMPPRLQTPRCLDRTCRALVRHRRRGRHTVQPSARGLHRGPRPPEEFPTGARIQEAHRRLDAASESTPSGQPAPDRSSKGPLNSSCSPSPADDRPSSDCPVTASRPYAPDRDTAIRRSVLLLSRSHGRENTRLAMPKSCPASLPLARKYAWGC